MVNFSIYLNRLVFVMGRPLLYGQSTLAGIYMTQKLRHAFYLFLEWEGGGGGGEGAGRRGGGKEGGG